MSEGLAALRLLYADKYSKRLTNEEYNKWFIIKRQIDTGSDCSTKFQALFRVNTN